jgi:c-di-GMP-binding flagellar brake protein YcgR
LSEFNNLREYSRVDVPLSAQIRFAEGDVFNVTIMDISMNGVLVNAGEEVAPDAGSECEIKILLGRTSKALPIVSAGKVVRRDHGNIAIAFKSVQIERANDLESLILFNSSDPLMALQEFSQHQG